MIDIFFFALRELLYFLSDAATEISMIHPLCWSLIGYLIYFYYFNSTNVPNLLPKSLIQNLFFENFIYEWARETDMSEIMSSLVLARPILIESFYSGITKCKILADFVSDWLHCYNNKYCPFGLSNFNNYFYWPS